MKPDTRALILAAMPGTRADIEGRAGLAKNTVQRWILKLHPAGACHISGWQANPRGGVYQAIFTVGNGTDAVCTLVKQSRAVERERDRTNAQANGTWADRMHKEAARKRLRRAVKTRWAAALFATETRGYF